MGGSAMAVRFWGVRGSVATPDPSCLGYGGNTACTELRVGDQRIIIDIGTGARALGRHLVGEAGNHPGALHLLVTHSHWDHIQGFPFFQPAYTHGFHLNIHGPAGSDKPLSKLFRDQMDTSYFPVPLTDLAAHVDFIDLHGDDTMDIGPVRVTAHYLNHPTMTLGYRFDVGPTRLAYVTDHEPYRHLLAARNPLASRAGMSRLDRALVDFVQDVDLFICEGQYTREEYESKIGWGHTSLDDLVQVGLDAKVKRMVMTHHDPDHDDRFVDGMVARAVTLIREAGRSIPFEGAREGMQIRLGD